MTPVLLFAAPFVALWALTWLALARRDHAVLFGLDLRQVVRERAIKIASGLLGAIAIAALVWALLPGPTPAGTFAVHGSWIVGVVFHFILWLAVSGLLHMLGCVLVLGGYVAEAGPRLVHGDAGTRAMAAGAQVATTLANRRPTIALHAFFLFGVLCLVGVALSHDRLVRPTEAGLAHDGFWSLARTVEPWEDIARLRLVRDPDPDIGEEYRWQLLWERADGGSALHLERDALWDVDRDTVRDVVAWHATRGIPVVDPREP